MTTAQESILAADRERARRDPEVMDSLLAWRAAAGQRYGRRQAAIARSVQCCDAPRRKASRPRRQNRGLRTPRVFVERAVAGAVSRARARPSRRSKRNWTSVSPAPSRLNIVVVGRSKAGKSTLFRALTGMPVTIGVGRQNTTRAPNVWTTERVRVADAPGFLGRDAEDLAQRAWEEVRAADLVVLVLTENRLDREDLAQSARLSSRAVPILLVMNVKSGFERRAFKRPRRPGKPAR